MKKEIHEEFPNQNSMYSQVINIKFEIGLFLFLGGFFALRGQSTFQLAAPGFTDIPIYCIRGSSTFILISTTWTGDINMSVDNQIEIFMSGDGSDFSKGRYKLATLPSTTVVQNMSVEFEMPAYVPLSGRYIFMSETTAPVVSSRLTDEKIIDLFPSKFNLSFLDENGVARPENMISICEGEKLTLDVDIEIYNRDEISQSDLDKYFQWTKDGQPFNVEETRGKTRIEVEESGMYGVTRINASERCTNETSVSKSSNVIFVNTIPLLENKIIDSEPKEICEGDSVIIEADNNSMEAGAIYHWYKNSVEVNGLTQPAYSLTVEEEGDYTLRVATNDQESACFTPHTNPVNVSFADLNAQIEGKNTRFIVEGSEAELVIETNIQSPDIEWFRNGLKIPVENDLTLEVDEEGSFYATLTAQAPCVFTGDTQTVKVEKIDSAVVTIEFGNDVIECQESPAEIVIQKIQAGRSGGLIDLPVSDYDLFEYQWFKDDMPLSELSTQITVEGVNNSGVYKLGIKPANSSAELIFSNEIEIVLSEMIEIESDNGNIYCDGSEILLSATKIAGASYSWFLDGNKVNGANVNSLEVQDIGAYSAEINHTNSCKSVSDDLLIEPFDDSSIVVLPSEEIKIAEGKEIEVSVTGGGVSFEWVNDLNVVLSTEDRIILDQEGDYVLTVFDGPDNKCEVSRLVTIEYFENATNLVPNVITPNGDGINDIWVLPSKYTNNTEIEVIIYDSKGNITLQQDNYGNDWSGTERINSLPSYQGVFYYLIKNNSINKVLEKGSITVIK